MDKIIFAPITPVYAPEYKTSGSAGGDLRAREQMVIPPHATIKVPSWLKIAMPQWYVFIIKPRSSLAVKKNLLVIEWTIDSDYRWEVSIVVYNLWDTPQTVEVWERIAQWIIVKLPKTEFDYSTNYNEFEKEYPTERWTWWFGSTWIL